MSLRIFLFAVFLGGFLSIGLLAKSDSKEKKSEPKKLDLTLKWDSKSRMLFSELENKSKEPLYIVSNSTDTHHINGIEIFFCKPAVESAKSSVACIDRIVPSYRRFRACDGYFAPKRILDNQSGSKVCRKPWTFEYGDGRRSLCGDSDLYREPTEGSSGVCESGVVLDAT